MTGPGAPTTLDCSSTSPQTTSTTRTGALPAGGRPPPHVAVQSRTSSRASGHAPQTITTTVLECRGRGAAEPVGSSKEAQLLDEAGLRDGEVLVT